MAKLIRGSTRAKVWHPIEAADENRREPPTPAKVSPPLRARLDRLDALLMTASNIFERVGAIQDRLTGSVPQAIGQGHADDTRLGSTGKARTLFGELDDAFDRLNGVLDGARARLVEVSDAIMG